MLVIIIFPLKFRFSDLGCSFDNILFFIQPIIIVKNINLIEMQNINNPKPMFVSKLIVHFFISLQSTFHEEKITGTLVEEESYIQIRLDNEPKNLILIVDIKSP